MFDTAANLMNNFLKPSDQGSDRGAASPASGGGVGQLLSGPGGLATGAVVGGLAGLFLGGKKPRKLASSALKLGGAAVVGGLAYNAWQKWSSTNTASRPSPDASAAPGQPASASPLFGTNFLPSLPAEQTALTTTLVRAMISAAKADGHITEQERGRIGNQLASLQIDPENRQFLEEELAKPIDIEALAAAAQNQEQAAEIYMASILIIKGDSPAEKGYLTMLAARLGLADELVEHLHATADDASVA